MAANDTHNDPKAFEEPRIAESSEHEKPVSESLEEVFNGGVIGGDKTKDATRKAQDLTTQALEFLSNASNETLGACIVGIGAATWLVLGRVGLIFIGVVIGVALHATWEGSSQGPINNQVNSLDVRKRREKGMDVVTRVLDWRERTKDEAQSDILIGSSQMRLDFSGFSKETASALSDLVDAVVRDYVKFWYSPVLPAEEAFPSACRQSLTGFLVAVSSHLSRKRPADTFLDFLTNSSSIVIVFLSELSAAVRAAGSSVEASEAVHAFLEANPDGSLANVLDAGQQKRKLRAIAEEILRSFVASDVYACDAVRIFLREILAGVILDMTVTSCSRAEFMNDWIIYSFEEGSKELVEAFDAGVSVATANGHVKKPLHLSDGERPFTGPTIETPSAQGSQSTIEHNRTVSRAEDAMEEAMQEAKRLSELIAAEEAKKEQSLHEPSSSGVSTTTETTATSSRGDLSAMTDISALSMIENPTETESKPSDPVPSFTTFDQIISSQQPTALQTSLSIAIPPLTLHNASVSIFDDSMPGEKGSLRSKPTAEYLLQVEPPTSQYPGWMIARTYSDFETLHEVLRRISVISGVATFAERHQTLPAWKNQTKGILRTELERYLRDALSYQRLAESEGMKRFLEKDQGLARASPGTAKGGFGFPSPAAFETMGKGMLDVLASAPKGAAGGGKAILGGVTGVFGGQKRQPARSPAGRVSDHASMPSSVPSPATEPNLPNGGSARSSIALPRESQDNSRHVPGTLGNEKPPPLPRRQSQAPSLSASDGVPKVVETNTATQPSRQMNDDSPPSQSMQDSLHLPPPPSEIRDDYKQGQLPPLSNPILDQTSLPTRTSDDNPPSPQKPPKREAAPLNSQETSVAVELFFAIINELYTLSSAWTLRLTLLNAAKTFLLRPGNPNLEAIRVLLQTTIIDANTTDASIASHIHKIRQNALPTEEELKAWPPPSTEEEKEKKRVKARKLLVEKGMPQALTSVMGAAASGEALGKVFDCLQMEEVARGIVFALVLQGVRAVTQ